MSAFGALPLDARRIPFNAVMASANKCLEGAPGMGFVVVRQDSLQAAEGNAHSLSLDLFAQWRGFEKNGQWRFTPPTHVVAAFDQALDEHAAEGGVAGVAPATGAICGSCSRAWRRAASIVASPGLAGADHRDLSHARRSGLRLRPFL